MAFDFSYLEGLEVNLAPDAIGWKVISGASALRPGATFRIEPTLNPPKRALIVIEIEGKHFMGEWLPRKRLDWLDVRDVSGSLVGRIKLGKSDPFTILGVVHVESEPTESEATVSAALRAFGFNGTGFDVPEDAQPEAAIEWPEYLEDPDDETPFAYWSEIDLPATKRKRKIRANATGLESA